MIELDKEGSVYILRMRCGENRFNAESLAALGKALDTVEQDEAAGALVTTGEGKFYSNGLDLDAMMQDASVAREVADGTQRLLARVLTLPMITVAACNGHAFAAGAMLALAHDFRVMREDRGWFCLPEVDIKIPFTPFMDAMIRGALPTVTAHEAMVTGKRYPGPEAVARGIAHLTAAEDRVLPSAVELAGAHAGKQRETLGAIKRMKSADALGKLDGPGALGALG